MGKTGLKIKSLVLLGALFLSSCIGTKYLKKGEYILYKQKIKSSGLLNEEAIASQFEQKANNRPLGLPINHTVHVYHLGKQFYDSLKIVRKKQKIEKKLDRKIARAKFQWKKSKLQSKKIQKVEAKDKKLREGNALMRWGEQLVTFDSASMYKSAENIKNYLFTKGYFKGIVKPSVVYKGQRAIVTYKIYEKIPYKIDSIIYSIKDPKVAEIFQANIHKQKFKGKQYDQDMFSTERNRVYDLLTNEGYFNFKRQYVLFEVDSTQLSNHQLIIKEIIANPPGKSNHKTYRLDSVVFANETSGPRRWQTYDNITFLLDDKYPKRVLSWRIFMEKDSLYSKDMTLETQKQLAYLDVFKFVNINYDSTGGKFIGTIFTSPLKKYQTSSEVGMSMLEHAQGIPGPFFNFNAKSRNTFGALELIQLDGNANIQGIKSFSQDNNNYSRFQYGGQLSITFPQFLFPLKESKRFQIGRYNPRTKFAAGVNFDDRLGEYRRNTFNANMSYIWQVKNNMSFTFKPIDINYIKSQQFGVFADTLAALERQGYYSLVNSFKSAFVSFAYFGFTYNRNNYGVGNNNASLFQGSIETGGVLDYITGKKLIGKDLQHYKFVRLNLDFKNSWRLSSKGQLAGRINIGAAYSYGDSTRALPYEKYFFAGGSNSIRAWQPRRLGPGAYGAYTAESTPDHIVVNQNREQQGDILFETSLEFRHDLVGFIDYAFFIDAGNIWLWNSRTVNVKDDGFGNGTDDDGRFRLKTFPQQIAVGSGFGLRFDFSFLVLRVDMAYKMVDPAYPQGQRFILDTYKFSDLWDLRNKANLNIGIGYPF